MANGKLADIPNKVISIRQVKKLNKTQCTQKINDNTDYLWDMDVEPTVKFPVSASKAMHNNKDKKSFSHRRCTHTASTEALFPSDPSPHDIEQMHIGDCWYLASISAIAALDDGPELLQQMMRDLGDGTVVVRMYDENRRARYIRLKKSVITHKPLRGQAMTFHASGPLWVIMLEKALTAFSHDRKFTPHDASYMNTIGGFADEAFLILLGIASTRKDISDPKKKNLTFEKLDCLLRMPSALGSMAGSDHFDIGLQATAGINSDMTITCEAILREVFAYSETLKTLRVNQQEMNKLVISMATLFLSQAQKLNLDNKFKKFYEAKTKREFTEKKIKKTVKGTFRLEDFITFMTDATGDNSLSVAGLDPVISTAITSWVIDKQLFPGKRVTGLYSTRQTRLYNKIVQLLAQKKPICMGTHTYVGMEIDSKGHSGGEGISKGLVGRHEYAILGSYQQGRDKFLLVRNPWGKRGRGYAKYAGSGVTPLPDRGGRVVMKPTSGKGGGFEQLRTGNQVFAIEAGTFWFELSDFTKRVSEISYTNAAPTPAD